MWSSPFSLPASGLLLHHVNHNVAGVNIHSTAAHPQCLTSFLLLVGNSVLVYVTFYLLCLIKGSPQQAPLGLLHKGWCFRVKICCSHSAFFMVFGFPWKKKAFNYTFTANESLLRRHSFTCSKYFKTHVHGHFTHTHRFFFPLLKSPLFSLLWLFLNHKSNTSAEERDAQKEREPRPLEHEEKK